ncbi:AraC family transcriptional regulator [Aliikangiella marina]|uniref:AraC family transcriptional regulator n=1 Tax=Aliikangiella marina TaxID=1712262 RepID=A0A545T143_9GAMM|nr:AraC family transcriptional regulator [Aliikangiella marina]TQV70930.1 AraC family transcriptional regulator [Aliikangiella marina]
MAHTPLINKAYLVIAQNLELAPSELLFKNTAIDLTDIDGSSFVEVGEAIQLVRNLINYGDEPNFATIFGTHLGAASHGPVGYAALSAPSVGKALSTFLEWFPIRADVYTSRVNETTDSFELIIQDNTGDDDFKGFFFEAFARALEILMTFILGQAPTNKTSIYFEMSDSGRKVWLEDAFDSLLYFKTQQNKLCIPKDIWFSVSPLFDRDSFEFNLAKCQQIMEERGHDSRLDLRIRQVIRKHFEQALVSSSPLPAPTQTVLSNMIFCSERTLIRKLKQLDTTYKQILEAERRRFAESLLMQPKYSILDIAQILGYSESANFCRAFKQWYGISPSQYRKTQ